MNNIKIRQETPSDYRSIYNVVELAFKEAEHTDNDEQNLVERLRKSDAYIPELSLVALIDDNVVGYIMFTKVKISNKTELAVAPLAVLPEYQCKGVGCKLILSGHEIAKQLGYDFSILLGHETYYPKFGYLKASNFGIISPFQVPEANFMAYNLQGNDIKLEGTVAYPKEFFKK